MTDEYKTTVHLINGQEISPVRCIAASDLQLIYERRWRNEPHTWLRQTFQVPRSSILYTHTDPVKEVS